MGKGKGEPDFWAAVVKPGTILYELGGVTEQQAKVCFARLASKLPVKVRFVSVVPRSGGKVRTCPAIQN